MGPISLLLFVLVFLSAIMYIGQVYTQFNITRDVWFIVTIAAAVAFAVQYIREKFFSPKKD